MIHIETSKKSYDTASISINTTPSSKGLYYINDAENHGIYCSDDLEMVKQIYTYAMEKADAGENIDTKDLKRQEIDLLKLQDKSQEKESSIEKDWDKIRKDLEKQLQNQKQCLKEREQLVKSIKEMESNEAPDDVVNLANKILGLADEIHEKSEKREQQTDNDSLEKDSLSQSIDNSYIIYKLENHFLTRANSAFKAGIVNVYDKLLTPLSKLHQYSLENQMSSEKAELEMYKKKLEKYTEKLSKKMCKRIEKTNATRRRNGLEPFPPDTVLYLPREQEKINNMTLTLNKITFSVSKLNQELENSKQKHQDRLQYVSDHKAISKNEKILEKHKKVAYKKEFVADPATVIVPSPTLTSAVLTPPDPSIVPAEKDSTDAASVDTKETDKTEQSETQKQDPPVPAVVTIPIYGPNGDYLGEQEITSMEAAELADATNTAISDSPGTESKQDMIENTDIKENSQSNPEKNASQQTAPKEQKDQESEPSIFSPVSERFAAAKGESKSGKELVTAKLLYRSLEQRLPINAMIEFEVNGNAFTASSNEYGDFEIKKYDFENAVYKNIAKDDVIMIFKENPAEYDAAIRDQLGEVLIGKASSQEKDVEQDK